MRIPKYRTWHKPTKIMDYEPIFLYDRNGIRYTMEQESEYLWETRKYADAFVWMESTGLFDSTGKEIYEGDLVEFTDMYGQTKLREIRWNDELASFEAYFDSNYTKMDTLFTVIGNIYETSTNYWVKDINEIE